MSALVLRRHTIRYDIVVFVVCTVLQFLLDMNDLVVPWGRFNLMIPLSYGFGPVLSLFFGLPAILGCSFLEFLEALFAPGVEEQPLIGTFAQMLNTGLPYFLWYLAMRLFRRKEVFPSLSSSFNVGLYLSVMVVSSAVNGLVSVQFLGLTSDVFQIQTIETACIFLTLIYIGIPTLIVLDFIPIEPLTPWFVKERYHQKRYMPLTQRMTLAFTAFVLAIIAFSAVSSYSAEYITGNEELRLFIASTLRWVAINTVVAFVVLTGYLHYLEVRLARPIERLTTTSKDFLGQLRRHEEDPAAKIDVAIDRKGLVLHQEMLDLTDAIDDTHASLLDHIDRLADATAREQREEADLDIARTIQLGALSSDFTSFIERFHIDIDSFFLAAKAVGGDLYEVFEVGAHSVAFVIGDVSGKGVPAALYMMRAQGILKNCILAHRDLGEAFTYANRALCEHNDKLTFVTAFACILDVSTGDVTFVNAGHNAPIVFGPERHEYIEAKPGLMLGVMSKVSYKSHSISLAPSEGIYLYTDGVTEACNEKLELFEEDRLLAEASEKGLTTATAFNWNVLDALNAFTGDQPQADDITMLCFLWNLPVSTLSLPPEAERLDEMFEWLEPLCTHEGCTPKMLCDLMLVCEELFVNIVHYGFPEGQPVEPVGIEVAVDDGRRLLHLSMSDAGIPYNPLEYDSEKVVPGVRHRIGGLGILLVRDSLDEIRYERSNGMNVLHMTKRFE